MKLKISYLFSLCIFSIASGQQLLSEEAGFDAVREETGNNVTISEEADFDINPAEEENCESTAYGETSFDRAPAVEANFDRTPAQLSDCDKIPADETTFALTPDREPGLEGALSEEANLDVTLAEEAGFDLTEAEKASFDRTLANEPLLSTNQFTFIECTFTPPPSSENFKQRQLQTLSHSSNVPNADPQGTMYSNNWSGYVASTNFACPSIDSVSSVGGIWLVPTLSSAPEDAFSAIWVGIDGFLNGTIEQIGTKHDWTSGSQKDFAWFQMHPNLAFVINDFPLNPGNLVGAISQHIGNGVFQLSIYNYTLEVFTIIPTELTTNPRAQRITAKWIVEAPFTGNVLSLANFNTIPMINCKAIINGVLGPVNSPLWQNKQIRMFQEVPKSDPTPLNPTGDAFIHIWKHA